MNTLRAALAGATLTVALGACGNGPPPDVVPSAGATPGASTVGIVVGNPASVALAVKATDELKFTPSAPPAVKVGDVVEWTNSGTAPHNITFDASGPAASLTDNAFNAGGTYAVKFTKAGKYTYQCTIHPGMNAEVDVS